MSLVLYAHPFSSYCWKALIALWENEVVFDYQHIDDPAVAMAWQQVSPMNRMPVLVDDERVIPEASVIIEYLHLHYPGPVPMLPFDAPSALQVRLLDRMSDNYLMTPTQTIVFDGIRTLADRDPYGVKHAKALLDKAYSWWNTHLNGREWAADAFGLADCATAPALFYADWVHPIPAQLSYLKDYRARLLQRPSIVRAVNDARPFRPSFPFGDPGRD